MKKVIFTLVAIMLVCTTMAQNFPKPETLENVWYLNQLSKVDFDNDGREELLTLTAQGDMRLYKMQNELNPVFSPLPSHTNVQSATTGDIDNDNIPDIVYTLSDNVIHYFKGNGDFTFNGDSVQNYYNESGVNTSASFRMESILDMTNDGKPDIVCSASNELLIAVNEDTTYRIKSGTNSGISTYSYDYQFADLNSDNNMDIVWADYNFFYIYFGAGDGTLLKDTAYRFSNAGASNIYNRIVLGKANDDIYWDIITLSDPEDSVKVYLGDANGKFTLYQKFEIEENVSTVIGEDINNDTYLDLLIRQNGGYTGLYVYEGTATGDYSLSYTKDRGVDDEYLAYMGQSGTINLNGDGITDFYFVEQGSLNYDVSMSFVVGAADGKPDLNSRFNSSKNYEFLFAADANYDDADDLFYKIYGEDSVFLTLNDGNGNMLDTMIFIDEGLKGVTSGLFNSDEYLDLVAFGDQTIHVYIGDGTGQFTRNDINFSGDYSNMYKADFNNDNNLDIFYFFGTDANVRLGNGDGTFGSALPFTITSSVKAVLIADFTNDGIDDIMTLKSLGNSEYYEVIYISQGDGTFTEFIDEGINHAIQYSNYAISGDFNNDGLEDIGAVNSLNSYLYIYLNQGDSTFSTGINFTGLGTTNMTTRISVADFNVDGYLDVAAIRVNYVESVNEIRIHYGNGTGGSSTSDYYFVERNPVDDLVIGQLNNDTLPDIITQTQTNQLIHTLINNFEFAALPTIPSSDITFTKVTSDTIEFFFLRGNSDQINFGIEPESANIYYPGGNLDTLWVGYSNLYPGTWHTVWVENCNGISVDLNCLPQIEDSIMTLVGDQIIDFDMPDSIPYSPVHVLTYTASSGLPVTYEVVSGSATLQGDSLLISALGDITLKAMQPGDVDHWNAAPDSTVTFKVYIAPQTLSTTMPNSMQYSPDTILLADYFSSTSGLKLEYIVVSGTDVAHIINDSILVVDSVGNFTVWVDHPGNTLYEPATQLQKTVTVNKADQSLYCYSTEYIDFTYDVVNLDSVIYRTLTSNLPVQYTMTSGNADVFVNQMRLVDLTQLIFDVQQPGSALYNPSNTRTVNVNVNQGDSEITVDSIPDMLETDIIYLANYFHHITNDSLRMYYARSTSSGGTAQVTIDDSTGVTTVNRPGQITFRAYTNSNSLFSGSGYITSNTICIIPKTPSITNTLYSEIGYEVYEATNVSYNQGLEWYNNGSELYSYSGRTYITEYSPLSGELYAIVDVEGCVSDQSNTLTLATSLDDHLMNTTKVYPVPASNLLNIEFGNQFNAVKNVSIFNTAGLKVMEVNIEANNHFETIDISDLPNGIYEAIFTIDNTVFVKSIIINE